MLNGLIFYNESVQQLRNFFISKDDKIFTKIYDSCKVTLLPVFLENSEPKTGKEHKFWQFWNELLYKLIILVNKPYFGLSCAN